MSDLDIRPISLDQALPLRRALLRPHQSLEELINPGDRQPAAFHAGAFQNGELVGIASVMREPLPGSTDPRAWRLRGMATSPSVRRQGFGSALVRACISHIAEHGGNSLWCNGRTTALPFYRSLGFNPVGDEFEVPYTGPHYVMLRKI